MKFRYTLEVLTIAAVIALCAIFLYTDSIREGTGFTGSDSAASGLVADLSGIPEENFHPLIPQWKPPSHEIESGLFALQAAAGGILVGGVFGFWIGQKKKKA